MDDVVASQSVQLCRALGCVTIAPRKSLGEALRLDGEVSFWDVVSTFLTLYRFPRLFPSVPGSHSVKRLTNSRLRPLRGIAARLKDVLVRIPRGKQACADWPLTKMNVVFVGFMKTFYRDVLSPVADLLVQGDASAVVIGQTAEPDRGLPISTNLRFHSLWDHWDDEATFRARMMSRRLSETRNAFARINLAAEFERTLSFPVATSALKSELSWLFRREFIRLIPFLVAARHILERHRPALIISADDADPRCRVFSLLGKTLGIPSLLVQQGLTSRAYPEWVFFSHDCVAAIGERSRNDMIAQGIPPENILVTGHPGFDRLVDVDPDTRAKARSAFGLAGDQKMILFASQPYYIGVFDSPQIRRTMIDAVVRAADSQPASVLVIKPHPGERTAGFRRLVRRYSRTRLAGKTAEMATLIKACDVLITFYSTSALEALYAGKPVINVDFPKSGGSKIYTLSGATWTARSEEDIAGYIARLTSGKTDELTEAQENARLKFLSEMTGAPDGKATERVTQAVMELVRP